MLLLNNRLLDLLESGQHMLNTPLLWAYLLGALVVVLLLRGVLQLVVMSIGINIRHELVIRDNPAWGILDGGLIFGILLLLIAVAG